jgi:hypothetical protein
MLGEYYSYVLLMYDATIQAYKIGVECTCLSPECDTSPNRCVAVDIYDYTCGVRDFDEGSDDMCHDCRICSLETGQIEIEADACFSETLGCIKLLLISSVPGSNYTLTPTPVPSTTPPTEPFTTVSPTDPFTIVPPADTLTTVPPTDTLTTVPPTDTFTTVPPTDPSTILPPGGEEVPSPIIGVAGSGGSGAFGYVHSGVLALFTTVFLTLSLITRNSLGQ